MWMWMEAGEVGGGWWSEGACCVGAVRCCMLCVRAWVH